MITTTSLKALLARPAAPTLAAQLRAAVARALILAGGLAAAAGLLYSIPGVDFGVGRLEYAPAVPAELVDEVGDSSRVERILERRGCWTGDAPADQAGKIPGGVVMSLVGGGVRYYGDDEHVGQALEHLFTSPDPQVGAVVGFCR